MQTIGVVVHGGATPKRGREFSEEREFLDRVSDEAFELLSMGLAAEDVVVSIASTMEESGLFIAGRGSSPNKNGVWELDACIMTGHDLRTGAVAGLVNFYNPLKVAREVFRRTPHTLLIGAGASTFAANAGFEEIPVPSEYYVPCSPRIDPSDVHQHGTIGIVALDDQGRLAAGTSTGGLLGKMPGRVGDSPIAGAGTWASDIVAVSCTGQGEFFVRTAAAVQIDHRMRFGGEDVFTACRNVIKNINCLGGDGGLIAIDRHGNIAMPFNSEAMKRAWRSSGDFAGAAVWPDEPQEISANPST